MQQINGTDTRTKIIKSKELRYIKGNKTKRRNLEQHESTVDGF